MHSDEWDARAYEQYGKPLLRGVFHSYTISAALAAGLVMLSTAKTFALKVAAAVYVCSLVNLFSSSTLFHRPNWSLPARNVLRRIDRASIYLLISGTYTPVCVAVLPERAAINLLTWVWTGAALGVLHQIVWPKSNRWIACSIYVLLGWAAVAYAGDLYDNLTRWQGWLLVLGGLLYSVGAGCFALHWPNPRPGIFAYHEVFHVFVIAGTVCHFCVIVLLLRDCTGSSQPISALTTP